MLKRLHGLVWLVLLASCATSAATQAPVGDTPAAHWAALTRLDVQSAYQMLSEDHPAMSREAPDAAFQARLDQGLAVALERASHVESYEGYLATLAGLANAAGDKHVWSRGNYASESVQWAGLITSRRGNRYVVVEHAGAQGDASLVGATLVSCDGLTAEDFAREKLGRFRAVWDIEAQRIQSAPLLLIDDGNPFVLKPSACVFERDGQAINQVLNWQSITRTELRPHLGPALNRGAAGFGVRDFAGGVWISLQSLDDRAPAVVEAVRTNAEHIRAARIVVLDLRGNGGGNSAFGQQIARIVFGDARMDAAFNESEDAALCNGVWRVSPRNLAQLENYQQMFRASAPETAAASARLHEAGEAARAAGRDFTGPATCEGTSQEAPSAAALPPSASRGRVVLLTDNACFSSCLLVTADFRRLGALHVGQTTDAATHFYEVREDRLPSGLSRFSTLQAFWPDQPASLGPFEPAAPYDGDIGDTAALEAWVVRTVRAN